MNHGTTPAAPAATPPGCMPWCTDHDDVGCGRTAAGTYGSVSLSTTSDGPRLFAYGVHDEFDLEDAERLGRTLLALAAAGRGRPRTVPAPRPASS